MQTPHPSPSRFAPGHMQQKPSKESGIFKHLAPLVLFFFAKKQSKKGGRGMEQCPPPKYAPAVKSKIVVVFLYLPPQVTTKIEHNIQ